MRDLLKIEWLKLKNYAAFKVLGILFLAGVALTNYITYRGVKNVTENVTGPGGLSFSFKPYSFYYVWQSTSYVSGWLLLLPAMLLIILVTNEYTYRTNRQNIIDGWSRRQFIEVKLMLGLIFAIVSAVMVIITASIFGFATGDSFSLNKFDQVLYFFLKALSYNLIAVLFSVLVRRTGFAIGLFFIYMGAENLISQLLNFWSMYLRSTKKIDIGSIGDYLPMNSADSLLTLTDNPITSMAKSAMPTEYPVVIHTLAFAWIILFIWWSRRKVMHSDL